MANASKHTQGITKRHVAVLARRRQRLLRVLLDSQPLIIGSVYRAYQRCGNPTCHCARGRGHAKTLLVYQEHGRRRCKLVRKADVPWVKTAAERYRTFRKALRALRALSGEELTELETLARSRAVEYV
jgi:hypothetical protein